MQEKSFLEKSTMLHSRRGSVGMALIAVFAAVMVLLPSLLFMLKVYLSKLYGEEAKEILQIASINACQAISREQLGTGVIVLDDIEAKYYFDECLDSLLNAKPYLKTEGDAQVVFSASGNKVTVESSIRIQSAFGNETTLNNSAEFITETLPEE